MFLFGGGSMRTRLLMVSLVLVGTGVWMILPTWNARNQETISVGRLYQGKKPASSWVKVDGRLLWDEAAIEENKYGSVTAYFVPLVPQTWEQGQAVNVFVRVRESDADDLAEFATIDGLIQPMGLPLDLRMMFDAEGPTPSSDAVYIHHGTNPKMQRQFAQVVIAIGFAGIGGFFVMGRVRKDAADTTYHSQAQPRKLGDPSRADPVLEQKRRQQDQERDAAVAQWMRERGIKCDDHPQQDADQILRNPAAAG